MRHPWLSVVLLLVATPALAQDQARPTRRFDVYVGYQACRGLDDNPQHLVNPSFRTNSLTLAFGWNITRSVALVVDDVRFGVRVSEYSGTGVDYSVLVGPRVRFGNRSRLSPFGQVLVGARTGAVEWPVGVLGQRQTLFQLGAGGGLDLRLRESLALRLVQIDIRRVLGGPVSDGSIGISGGVVFRFGARVDRGQ